MIVYDLYAAWLAVWWMVDPVSYRVTRRMMMMMMMVVRKVPYLWCIAMPDALLWCNKEADGAT